jgi:teichuronic acid biosynthesis glycosyltransferase TuaC
MALSKRRSPSNLRVLMVIPGRKEGYQMIFVKRQLASLLKASICIEPFFLKSRTSVLSLARERKALKKVVQSFRPDLIHAQYGTMTGFFCGTVFKVPLIVTYRGNDIIYCSSRPLRRFSGMLLSQLTALRASQIVCVSEEIRQKLWWHRKLVTVIPSGVDTSLFKPRPRHVVRSELGWRKDELIVLFNKGGQKVKTKRLDLAQASVNVAQNRLGFIRFIILDGQTEPNDIPSLMSGADCLLLTSDSEGSPNIVKEAMACNLPIVSVDVGDVADRLRNVRPSRIVARDPNELGWALVEILQINQRSNGYEIIQKDLALERIAERILVVYQKALAAY